VRRGKSICATGTSKKKESTNQERTAEEREHENGKVTETLGGKKSTEKGEGHTNCWIGLPRGRSVVKKSSKNHKG